MSCSKALRCAALCAFTAACGSADDAPQAAERDAVTGGTVSGPEDDAVVRLAPHEPDPYGDFSCTGVLLAPNVVLTALQCVSVADAIASSSCLPDGSLDPSRSGGWIGQTLDPSNIDVYFGSVWAKKTPDAHAARVFGSGSTTICIDDVAVIVLDTPLPSRGVPVRTQRPIVAGDLVTVIGFGSNGMTDNVMRARRSGIPVLDVGPDDITGGLGTAAPRSFIVGDGPCQNENGAPALSDETGAVIGVLAFNFGGDCLQPGGRGWFAEVLPFKGLLDEAFAFAGGHPVEETTPATTTPPTRSTGCQLTPRSGPGEPLSLLAAGVLLFTRRKRASVRRVARS